MDIIEKVLGKKHGLDSFTKNEASNSILTYLVVKKALDMDLPITELNLYKNDSLGAFSYCYDNDIELPLKKNQDLCDLRDKLSVIIDQIVKKSLNKATKDLEVKPPSPPKAGSNVGGTNGISKTGFHEPKSEASDSARSKPATELKSPDLKVSPQAKKMFKMPKLPKLMANENLSLKLSEKVYRGCVCADCSKPISSCVCFSDLSKPHVSLNKNEVKLTFGKDWDKDLVKALYKSIKSK